MNFKSKVLLPLALCGALCGSGEAASAKPAQPKTVLDYFLLLPDKNYFAVSRSKAQREAQLRDKSSAVQPIVDIKNDYILFPGGGAQGTLQFAVFRHQGRALIVVRDDFEDGSLDFLRYENGQWKDVTTRMMPAIYDVHHDYHVPRWGTTIKVTAGRKYFKDLKIAPNRGRKVYDFIWTGGQFKVKR